MHPEESRVDDVLQEANRNLFETDSRRHAALDRFAIYCGPIAQMLFFLFLPLSGQLPPISPSLTAEETADYYRQHKTGMKVGICCMLLTAIFWPIFCAGINRQLSKIPHASPTALWGQLTGGCLGSLSMMIPSFFFSVVIYRLERDPILTQTMSDLAWFVYAMGVPPFLGHDMMVSYAILSDDRSNPLIPHWVAWVNTGLTLTLYPAFVVHCVHSGPLAWNGALGFWLGGAGFGAQVGLLVFHFKKALVKPIELD